MSDFTLGAIVGGVVMLALNVVFVGIPLLFFLEKLGEERDRP